MMIIIFVIIINNILNEKGVFVINLNNILIVLITMMTAVRLANQHQRSDDGEVEVLIGSNTDLMSSHLQSNGNQTHPCSKG